MSIVGHPPVRTRIPRIWDTGSTSMDQEQPYLAAARVWVRISQRGNVIQQFQAPQPRANIVVVFLWFALTRGYTSSRPQHNLASAPETTCRQLLDRSCTESMMVLLLLPMYSEVCWLAGHLRSRPSVCPCPRNMALSPSPRTRRDRNLEGENAGGSP
ncbi:hypothetical protein GQ53DRAFT_262497 [Thozetella sp. PMI_491]|nr:hypothetical protein GQ53DRAFT_262497 [Thozetella sp. PMI_491]